VTSCALSAEEILGVPEEGEDGADTDNEDDDGDDSDGDHHGEQVCHLVVGHDSGDVTGVDISVHHGVIL